MLGFVDKPIIIDRYGFICNCKTVDIENIENNI